MEETFSKEESLSLISQMINAAKKEQTDNGVKWIVWGWILFAVSILTVINLNYHWFSVGFFWNTFGALVLVYCFFTVIRYRFFTKTEKVKVKGNPHLHPIAASNANLFWSPCLGCVKKIP